MLRVAGLLALSLLLLGLPTNLLGQERECDFQTRDATGRAIREQGTEIFVIFDPFIVTCDDGAQLRANSGRYDQSISEAYLLGDVYFEDGDRVLTANEATYNAQIARLYARGDVVFIDRADGSTLTGPDLEYYRTTEERPLSQMMAEGRPTLTRTPPEGSERSEPVTIIADRVTMIGDDDLSAFGSVVITRTDFNATSGEARFNTVTEDIELRDEAVVRGEEFDLRGEVIQARTADGSIDHIVARTNAALEGEINVSGDELQLFFSDDLLQRAVARVAAGGTDRAIAESPTFRMEADSLDATFIDQQLNEVLAIGRAQGETIDTVAAAPPTARDTTITGEAAELLAAAFERDWIRGDTIIGYFVPRAVDRAVSDDDVINPEPSAVEAENDRPPPVDLQRLVARGSAQSLYRVAAEGAEAGERRNLNFLVGQQIELELGDGELQVAHVEGLQVGVYLEADPQPQDEIEELNDTNAPGVEAVTPDVDPEIPVATPGAPDAR